MNRPTLNDLSSMVTDMIVTVQKAHPNQSGNSKKAIAMESLRILARNDERLIHLINQYADYLIDFTFEIIRDKNLRKVLKKNCKMCF